MQMTDKYSKVALRKSGKGGFTLIELLIYTGILILLVAVVGSTLLSMGRAYRSLVAEQAVAWRARRGMPMALTFLAVPSVLLPGNYRLVPSTKTVPQ